MSNENVNTVAVLFEQASRLKLRFDTNSGTLAVEDLWDLPLTSAAKTDLDDIAQGLHRELKDSEEVSFVVKTQRKNERLELAFDIVKHVIEVKIAERDAARGLALRKEKKQQLLALLADKKNEELKGKSAAELEEMVAGL